MAQRFAGIRVQVRATLFLRRSLGEFRRLAYFAVSPVAKGVEGINGNQKRFVYALSLFPSFN
jgi:hypothetical protein